MADPVSEGINQLGGKAAAAASSTYDILLWVLGFLVVAALVGLIIWIVKHNRFITINYITKGNVKYVVKDKARLKHYKGAEYWSLLRLKKMWLAPPGQAVRITKKGKFYAECNYNENDDHPIWVILKDAPPVDLDGQAVDMQQTYFSPEDRSHLVEQLEEAENRKKKILALLAQMVVPITLFMMFVLVLVFWNDIWQPMKESQQQMAVVSQQLAKVSEQNVRLYSVMAGKLDRNELIIPQVVPGDAALFNNTGGAP